jgi:hypothetical protein
MGQRTVKTQTAVQVVPEVEGEVSLRQFNPSIYFLLATIEPSRHHTMVSNYKNVKLGYM